MAIPGVSRADVQTIGNGAYTGEITSANPFQYLYFKTANVSGGAFTFDNLRLYTGASGFAGTITLSLYSGTDQSGGVLGTVISTDSIVADSYGDIALNTFGIGPVGANAAYNIKIAAAFDVGKGLGVNETTTLTNLSGSGVFQNNSFGHLVDLDPTLAGAKSFSTEFTASVPEPTTMILTGSVLAAGFGASVLRRFRKKQVEQAAI